MRQGMQWPEKQGMAGPQLAASKKTVTLVLQPQELSPASNSNKQGTKSPLKTPERNAG